MTKARQPAGRPKRPEQGGYPRGDETRQKVIEAGLDVFGKLGMEAASTRAIAQRAGVNLPALHYYFGSKEGLYQACANYIAERVEGMLQPAHEAITTTLEKGTASRDELMQLLHALLEAVAEVMLGSREPEEWVRFMIREQASPTEAFEVLYERIMSKVIGMMTSLFAALLGRADDEAEVRIMAMSTVGQLLFFRTARETALRTLNWSSLNQERVEQIKAVIRGQVDRAVSGVGDSNYRQG